MCEYKVLALDLDGTLTNSKKKVTIPVKKNIEMLIDKGIHIVLASGRPILGIQSIAKELGLYDKGGFILANNGGNIVECKTGNIIYKKEISAQYYHCICEIGHRIPNVEVIAYDNAGIMTEDATNPYVQQEAYNNGANIRLVKNLENELVGLKSKFMVVGEPKALKPAFDYLKKELTKLNVFYSEPYFIEIVPNGIEKAAALQIILNNLGYRREQLVACGDGLNDIQMLQYAGLSIAMDNGCDEIKAYADYIAPSNDEDGIAIAIKKFLI